MSEMCEHPFCTRLISNKCSNHCQLDLCNEHLIEHKNLFVVQYEKSFNNLKKSFNELINLIEAKKTQIINNNYEKNISLISKNSNNKLNDIEQKSSLIFSTQNFIKKKTSTSQIIDERKSCLFHDTPKENGIRCTSLITEKFLPIHLKTIHRFRFSQIKDILNSK
jgi:hypothetical protein